MSYTGWQYPVVRVVQAATVYFVVVFMLGVALGTLRVIYLAPAIGELAATLLELPLMLSASWVLCGVVVRRWIVPPTLSARIAMGALAFVLLISSEVYLGANLLGRGLNEQLGAMTTGAGLAGAISQIIFATFPVIRLQLSTGGDAV